MRSKSTSSSTNPISPINADLKDEICSVCRQWKASANDFKQNFISCVFCRRSFHRQCIVFPTRLASKQQAQRRQPHQCCHQFADRHSPTQALRCQEADEDAPPQLLVQNMSEKFHESYYIEHEEDADDGEEDNETVYFDSLQVSQQSIRDKHHPKKVFTRWKTAKIKYKNIIYRVGDCVEVRNERLSSHEFDTNVGIIQRIHVFDERDVDALPTLQVFWFWRESELRRKLCQYPDASALLRIPDESGYGDHRLFADIECASKVSMAAVCHKVLVCDSLSAFLETRHCKFTGFGNVCFSTHTFTSGDYERYGRSPFAAMTHAVFVHSLLNGFKHELAAFRRECQRSSAQKLRAKSIEKVRKFLDTYAQTYEADDDEVKCMAENAQQQQQQQPSCLRQQQQQQQRHGGGGDEDGDVDDENEIAMSMMKSICVTLGISRIKHDIAVYGFNNHVAVYCEILRLVKMDSDSRRKAHLLEMSASKLRDIKAKSFSEGKIRKQEMVENIAKKLLELRKYYQTKTAKTMATTAPTRKRKQLSGEHMKTDNRHAKRQRI